MAARTIKFAACGRFWRAGHGQLRRPQAAAVERRRKKYALADNFFQAAFGGSFLNHFQLVCACVPVYPERRQDPPRSIAVVDTDGVSLTVAPDSPKSALDGAPKFVNMTGQCDARFLRRQHDAAALSAERRQAGAGRRSGALPIRARRTAAAANRSDDRRSLEREGRDLGLVCRRLAGRAQTATAPRRSELSSFIISRSTISPITRPAPPRVPSICATAA